MSRNSHIRGAQKAKRDEFYTRKEDVENELQHYEEHFRGQIVYCNCDDYKHSAFYNYFRDNFKRLGLRKLIATCYQNELSEKSTKAEFDGTESISELNGDGDFRSKECLEILRDADIIVTNPPFSLFISYFQQLIDEQKKFLVVASNLTTTRGNVFPQLRDRNVWLGLTQCSQFETPYSRELRPVQTVWLTNLENRRVNPPMNLVRRYKGFETEFPKYDNADAIEVSRISEIPYDYEGVMGVPISFFEKWNQEQFDIIGAFGGTSENTGIAYTIDCKPMLDGKDLFCRVLIQNRNPKDEPDEEDRGWL